MAEDQDVLLQQLIVQMRLDEAGREQVAQRVKETLEQMGIVGAQIEQRSAREGTRIANEGAQTKRAILDAEMQQFDASTRKRITSIQEELRVQRWALTESIALAERLRQAGVESTAALDAAKDSAQEVSRLEKEVAIERETARGKKQQEESLLREAGAPTGLGAQLKQTAGRSMAALRGSPAGQRGFREMTNSIVGALSSMGGAAGQGAVAGAAGKLGGEVLGGLLGMGAGGPMMALVGVVTSLKDLISASYERELRLNAEQATRMGGTAELSRRSRLEQYVPGAAAEARELAVAFQKQMEDSQLFSAEESKAVGPALDKFAASLPRFDQTKGEDVQRMLFGLMDVARQTGMKQDDLAKIAGDIARRQGYGGDAEGGVQALSQIARINAMAMTMAEATGKIDSQAMVRRVLEAEQALRPLGYSFTEAAGTVRKWALDLERGTVTMGQLIEVMAGAKKQEVGIRAFEANELMQLSQEEANKRGVGLTRRLVEKAGDDDLARAQALTVGASPGLNIGTLSKLGFFESLGIGEKDEKAKAEASRQLGVETRSWTQQQGEAGIERTMPAGATDNQRTLRALETIAMPYGRQMAPGAANMTGPDAQWEVLKRGGAIADTYNEEMAKADVVVKQFAEVMQSAVAASQHFGRYVGTWISGFKDTATPARDGALETAKRLEIEEGKTLDVKMSGSMALEIRAIEDETEFKRWVIEALEASDLEKHMNDRSKQHIKEGVQKVREVERRDWVLQNQPVPD